MESAAPPGYPAHRGHYFTRILHSKAEGSTLPTAGTLPDPFVVAITGAGKGIGAAIALAYAQAGATGIVLASRSVNDLQTVSSKLQGVNHSIAILTQPCDVTCENDVQALVAKTRETFHRLDVLINSAGTTPARVTDAAGSFQRGPFGILEGSTSEFLRVLEVNLAGVYLVTRHFIPLLLATPGAKTIVTMASEGAHSFKSDLTPICYSMSKLATIRLMETIYEAHKEEEILTYAVHPGAIVTDMTAGLPPAWVARKCTTLPPNHLRQLVEYMACTNNFGLMAQTGNHD